MRQRGFTLLEVLVATLIMAIAVTGLLSALSTSMRNAARLTDYDRAVQLSRQKMDELLIATDKLPLGVPISGAWENGVRWQARITAFDQPEPPLPGAPILERVELVISWTSGDQPRTFALEGYKRAEAPRP